MYKLIRFVTKKADCNGKYSVYLHEQGRALLKKALNEYCNILFSEENVFFGKKGKPYINDAFFNISHTDGMVSLALSDCENGADCERLRAPLEKVIKRCFTPYEADQISASESPSLNFTRLWTLKEAYSKLTGEGISALGKTEFDLAGGKALFDCGCDFYQYLINGEYCAAFCEKNGAGNIFFQFTDFDIDKPDILL